jgi:hypothetical protein
LPRTGLAFFGLFGYLIDVTFLQELVFKAFSDKVLEERRFGRF